MMAVRHAGRAGAGGGSGRGHWPGLLHAHQGHPDQHLAAVLVGGAPCASGQAPDPALTSKHSPATVGKLLKSFAHAPRQSLALKVQPLRQAIMTFTLVMVVYATAVTKPGHGNIAPLAIGFTLFASAFVGAADALLAWQCTA